MRSVLILPMMCLAVSSAAPAFAETVQLNHLDCRFNEEKKVMVCPDVLAGRSAAEPAVVAPAPAPAAPGSLVQGSPEWNAACAAKYKSFDASTGMYKSFSGLIKPCRSD
jgi:hypothetical protein